MSRLLYLLMLCLTTSSVALAQQPALRPELKRSVERPVKPVLDWREFVCDKEAECQLGWELNSVAWNQYVLRDTEWIRTDPQYYKQELRDLAVRAYAQLPRGASPTFPSDNALEVEARRMEASAPKLLKAEKHRMLQGIYAAGVHPDEIRFQYYNILAEAERVAHLCRTDKGTGVAYRIACADVSTGEYPRAIDAMRLAIAQEKLDREAEKLRVKTESKLSKKEKLRKTTTLPAPVTPKPEVEGDVWKDYLARP